MTQRKSTGEHLTTLLQATGKFRGDKSLAAFVLSLTREFSTRLAFITEKRIPQAHALAMADREDLKQPVYYDHRQTPCRAVLDGEVVSVPCNVADIYPGHAGLQSYLGVPLFDTTGQVIGLVAVMDERPFEDLEGIKQVLVLLAPRIAAELECVRLTRSNPGTSATS